MLEADPRLMTIVGEALEQVGLTSRNAYLDRICGDDTTLRRRVEALLAAHDKAGRFLEPQPVNGREPQHTPSQEPDLHNQVGEATLTLSPSTTENDANRTLGSVRYFGDYELLEEIARGGMGVVFRARQASLNREVALKMIKVGELASASEVVRFKAEAEAAANLDHPNILPIYEIGQHLGQQYFSMKLVSGRSLVEKVSQFVNDPKSAVTMLVKVCQAVDFAHRRGILHRDLKPGNILLNADGTPYVADFGLAKKIEGDSKLTQSGAIVGTPSYMAPEQARPGKGVTTAVDVYALGAILYELLTGQPPFRGSNAVETVLQVLDQEAVSPTTLNPKADRDLSLIAMTCLAKDPAKRYESATALGDDLQRWLNGVPILARPVGWMERARKWVWRNKGLSVGLFVAIIALLAGSGVSAWQAAKAWRAAEEEARQRQIAVDEKKVADVARKDAIDRLYSAQLNLAKDAWNDGDVRRTLELLREFIPEEGLEDLRGFEWYYLWRCCHCARLSVDGTLRGIANSHIFRGVALSPDGQRIAYPVAKQIGAAIAIGMQRVVIQDVDSGKQINELIAPHPFIPSLAFSPDGQYLAAVSWNIGLPAPKPVATVWDAATGNELYQLELDGDKANSVSFSNDGLKLALSSGSAETKAWNVRIVESKNGKLIQNIAIKKSVWQTPSNDKQDEISYADEVKDVHFNPDGKRIAVATQYSGVTIFDSTTGKDLLNIPHPNGIWGLAYSPDGKQIATACEDRAIKVWNAITGGVLFTLDGHRSAVDGVAFSPDGQLLVSTGHDGTIRFWDTVTKKMVGQLKGHTSAVGKLVLNKDGTRLATAGFDMGIKVWDINPLTISSQEVMVLNREIVSAVTGICFSGDGKLLASCSAPGTITIWDPTTGDVRWRRQISKEFVNGVAFSPDAQRIALADLQSLHIWDWKTNTELCQIAGQRESISFTANGEEIVAFNHAGFDRHIEFWSVAAKRLDRQIEESKEFAVQPIRVPLAFSADRRLLAAGSISNVWIWNMSDGQRIQTLNQGGVCRALSPDGRLLAVVPQSGASGNLEIWNVQTGERTLTLKGHSSMITSAAFSPDGRRIATGTQNGQIKFWSMTTGQETFTIKAHTNDVRELAFSPDGHRLVSASGDCTIKVWNAAPINVQAGMSKPSE